jgi:hypothetical protein
MHLLTVSLRLPLDALSGRQVGHPVPHLPVHLLLRLNLQTTLPWFLIGPQVKAWVNRKLLEPYPVFIGVSDPQ